MGWKKYFPFQEEDETSANPQTFIPLPFGAKEGRNFGDLDPISVVKQVGIFLLLPLISYPFLQEKKVSPKSNLAKRERIREEVERRKAMEAG